MRYSSFVLRQPLPPNLEETRELFLMRKPVPENATTAEFAGVFGKNAGEKIKTVRAYFRKFPMLRRVDRIRVRPNAHAGTVRRTVEGLSGVAVL